MTHPASQETVQSPEGTSDRGDSARPHALSAEAVEPVATSWFEGPDLAHAINRALLADDISALKNALSAYEKTGREACDRMRPGPIQPPVRLTGTAIGDAWIVADPDAHEAYPNIAASELPVFTVAELTALAGQGVTAIRATAEVKRVWPTATVVTETPRANDPVAPVWREIPATPVEVQLPLLAAAPDVRRAPIATPKRAEPKPAEPSPPPGTTGTRADGYFCPHIDETARQAEANRGRKVRCADCFLAAHPEWRTPRWWLGSILELQARAESLRRRREMEEEE